ncbi:MAG: Kdo hydroxylase family protein [Terriglobia bacterium]
MALIRVEDYSEAGWGPPERTAASARAYCRQLERGDILFFPSTPFALPEDDRNFLLGAKQTETSHHKNISYKPRQDRINGLARGSADESRLRAVMRVYSQTVADFLQRFLVPYAGHWRLDFASFRPIEEEGRDLPQSKRNDLLHVDSFPTRPANGDRILRVFTNLNPEQSRVWLTGDPFDVMVQNFGGNEIGRIVKRARTPWRRFYRAALRLVGRAGRPLYDELMLGLHHAMKRDPEFQRNSHKSRWEFPPGSTWLVYTDMVPHAVLTGRFALEQTFIVSRTAMVEPEKAPCNLLRELTGAPVIEG